MRQNNLQRAFAGIAAAGVFAGSTAAIAATSANFITPNDRHSAAYRGVLIEGVMTNPFGAEDPTKASRLAAGSDW